MQGTPLYAEQLRQFASALDSQRRRADLYGQSGLAETLATAAEHCRSTAEGVQAQLRDAVDAPAAG